MMIDPGTMSVKGRAGYLHTVIEETHELLAFHTKLMEILGEQVSNPVVHHGKHENNDYNRAYQQYKKVMIGLKQNEAIIEELMKYDGRTAGDNNKESAGLHTT